MSAIKSTKSMVGYWRHLSAKKYTKMIVAGNRFDIIISWRYLV